MNIDLQIAAAARELRLRQVYYPKAIERQKMKPETAAHELAAMEAILDTLKQVKFAEALKRETEARQAETRG